MSQNIVELDNEARYSRSIFVATLIALRNEGKDTIVMKLCSTNFVNGPHREGGDWSRTWSAIIPLGRVLSHITREISQTEFNTLGHVVWLVVNNFTTNTLFICCNQHIQLIKQIIFAFLSLYCFVFIFIFWVLLTSVLRAIVKKSTNRNFVLEI